MTVGTHIVSIVGRKTEDTSSIKRSLQHTSKTNTIGNDTSSRITISQIFFRHRRRRQRPRGSNQFFGGKVGDEDGVRMEGKCRCRDLTPALSSTRRRSRVSKGRSYVHTGRDYGSREPRRSVPDPIGFGLLLVTDGTCRSREMGHVYKRQKVQTYEVPTVDSVGPRLLLPPYSLKDLLLCRSPHPTPQNRMDSSGWDPVSFSTRVPSLPVHPSTWWSDVFRVTFGLSLGLTHGWYRPYNPSPLNL